MLSPRASGSTTTPSRSSSSRPKPAPASIAGRFPCSTADTTPQPLLGFLTRREGILGTASVKLSQNWLATASVRYDIDANSLAGTVFGIGYIDDCLIVALNYITNYTYSGNVGTDQRVMLQMTLRTLGGTSISQGIGSTGNGL